MAILLFASPIIGLIILGIGIYLYLKDDDENGSLGAILTMVGAIFVILPLFAIMLMGGL